MSLRTLAVLSLVAAAAAGSCPFRLDGKPLPAGHPRIPSALRPAEAAPVGYTEAVKQGQHDPWSGAPSWNLRVYRDHTRETFSIMILSLSHARSTSNITLFFTLNPLQMSLF